MSGKLNDDLWWTMRNELLPHLESTPETEHYADCVRTVLDLCELLGHDPWNDEPDRCGRCDEALGGTVDPQ